MSGGALTDYRHDLYRMCDWADGLEKVNPILATQVRDMCLVLYKYDRFLSGDISEEDAVKAWDKYLDKWSTEVIYCERIEE